MFKLISARPYFSNSSKFNEGSCVSIGSLLPSDTLSPLVNWTFRSFLKAWFSSSDISVNYLSRYGFGILASLVYFPKNPLPSFFLPIQTEIETLRAELNNASLTTQNIQAYLFSHSETVTRILDYINRNLTDIPLPSYHEFSEILTQSAVDSVSQQNLIFSNCAQNITDRYANQFQTDINSQLHSLLLQSLPPHCNDTDTQFFYGASESSLLQRLPAIAVRSPNASFSPPPPLPPISIQANPLPSLSPLNRSASSLFGFYNSSTTLPSSLIVSNLFRTLDLYQHQISSVQTILSTMLPANPMLTFGTQVMTDALLFCYALKRATSTKMPLQDLETFRRRALIFGPLVSLSSSWLLNYLLPMGFPSPYFSARNTLLSTNFTAGSLLNESQTLLNQEQGLIQNFLSQTNNSLFQAPLTNSPSNCFDALNRTYAWVQGATSTIPAFYSNQLSMLPNKTLNLWPPFRSTIIGNSSSFISNCNPPLRSIFELPRPFSVLTNSSFIPNCCNPFLFSPQRQGDTLVFKESFKKIDHDLPYAIQFPQLDATHPLFEFNATTSMPTSIYFSQVGELTGSVQLIESVQLRRGFSYDFLLSISLNSSHVSLVTQSTRGDSMLKSFPVSPDPVDILLNLPPLYSSGPTPYIFRTPRILNTKSSLMRVSSSLFSSAYFESIPPFPDITCPSDFPPPSFPSLFQYCNETNALVWDARRSFSTGLNTVSHLGETLTPPYPLPPLPTNIIRPHSNPEDILNTALSTYANQLLIQYGVILFGFLLSLTLNRLVPPLFIFIHTLQLARAFHHLLAPELTFQPQHSPTSQVSPNSEPSPTLPMENSDDSV